jgi:hypothetical protein
MASILFSMQFSRHDNLGWDTPATAEGIALSYCNRSL